MASALLFSLLLAASGPGDDAKSSDVRSLIAEIDRLQKPLQDLRCEWEQTIHFKGKAATQNPVREDGLHSTSRGIDIWKAGGYIRSESFRRMAVDGLIVRQSVAVRLPENLQEFDTRSDEDPRRVRRGPGKVTGSHFWDNGYGMIFLIDEIKRLATDKQCVLSVSHGELDGRRLKVLNVELAGIPDSLLAQHFIDLERSGHVVRTQFFFTHKVSAGWLDIKLAPFRLGDAEIWMPVSGESVGLAAVENGRPLVTKEPQSIRTLRVVPGTMEFNKRPGPGTFTTQYNPGPPFSKELKELDVDYARQQRGEDPAKPALKQPTEKAPTAIAGPTPAPAENLRSTRASWPLWAIALAGGLVVLGCAGLWILIQRR